MHWFLCPLPKRPSGPVPQLCIATPFRPTVPASPRLGTTPPSAPLVGPCLRTLPAPLGLSCPSPHLSPLLTGRPQGHGRAPSVPPQGNSFPSTCLPGRADGRMRPPGSPRPTSRDLHDHFYLPVNRNPKGGQLDLLAPLPSSLGSHLPGWCGFSFPFLPA